MQQLDHFIQRQPQKQKSEQYNFAQLYSFSQLGKCFLARHAVALIYQQRGATQQKDQAEAIQTLSSNPMFSIITAYLAYWDMFWHIQI